MLFLQFTIFLKFTTFNSKARLQGRMQDFCNGVSISKKLAVDKINATGEFEDMQLHIYVYHKQVCKAPLACEACLF